MLEEDIQHLVKACMKIEEDALYTAEAHFLYVGFLNKLDFWVKFLPPTIAVLSSAVVVAGGKTWIAWIAAAASTITLIGKVYDIKSKQQNHLKYAKEFTIIKKDARYLYEVTVNEISRDKMFEMVSKLKEKLNLIIKDAPMTKERYFYKARKKIKSGIHTPDYIINNNGV